MSIKTTFNALLKKLRTKDSSIEVKTTSLCACEKTIDSPALLTKTITLKTSDTGEFSSAYHGLDYHKIKGYTVALDIGALVLPYSNYPESYYEAWVAKGSVVLKVNPDLSMTHDKTVHFILSYVK